MPASKSQKGYLCDVTGWLLAPVGSYCAYVYSRAIELTYGYVILCNLQLYPRVAAVCVLQ